MQRSASHSFLLCYEQTLDWVRVCLFFVNPRRLLVSSKMRCSDDKHPSHDTTQQVVLDVAYF